MTRSSLGPLVSLLCLLSWTPATCGQDVSPTTTPSERPCPADGRSGCAPVTALPVTIRRSFGASLLFPGSDPPAPTGGAGPAAGPRQQPGSDAAELAKKLSNPIADLISLPFQSNFDFGLGPEEDGFRYTLNVQPVVPFALSPKWNLISRTILPVIHQSDVVGAGSQTGLGDVTQSFFFSPNKTEPFILGFGPALLIPTATDSLLGTKKFGLGPTVLVLKQSGGWTYGMLVNHIWSVAGADDRPDVNNTFLQPFLAYNTKTAWTYGINTESSYDWTGKQWSVPIHLTISKLVRFGKQPVSFGAALRCWATSPSGGAKGCGFRLIVTPLFPKG